jgi:protein-S-isoprenylcysteine O-methyltransferase Ste14
MLMEQRGKAWFICQFILFCSILLAPVIEQVEFPLRLRAIGVAVLVCGVIIAVLGYCTLGSSHSPWTSPIDDGHFKSTGIYSYIRHPIYVGWIVGALGWELLAKSLLGVGVTVVLLVFYDLKSCEEEKWLVEKYTDYAAYKDKVKRFVPWVY